MTKVARQVTCEFLYAVIAPRAVTAIEPQLVMQVDKTPAAIKAHHASRRQVTHVALINPLARCGASKKSCASIEWGLIGVEAISTRQVGYVCVFSWSIKPFGLLTIGSRGSSM